MFLIEEKTYLAKFVRNAQGRANYLTCLPYSSFAKQRGGEGKKIKKIKNKNQ